jgi:hypothetical protein
MRRVLLISLFALLALPVSAQSTSKAVVDVQTAIGPPSVAAGSTVAGTVTLAIRSGYHINAEKPTEDYLIGTKLTMTPPAGISVAKTVYPAADYATFKFSETPLAVYEGTAKIAVTFKTDASVAAGKATIPGKLQFQACNDEQCLPPSTVDVSFEVDVAGSTAAKKQTLTLAGLPPDARVAIDGKTAGKAGADGRFVARDLETGRRRVRVEMEGYAPWEQTVELDDARPQTVTVALESSPAAAPTEQAPAAAPPEPAATPAEPAIEPSEEPSSGSSTALYVVGALAFLAIAGAGYWVVSRK